MSYIGQGPFQEFTNPPTKDSFTGDGSTTTFDLNSEVPSGSQNALEVYVDNVRQEPGTGKAFTLGVDGSGDIKRITFTAAPANGASIYVINDKTNSTIVAPLQNDLNGTFTDIKILDKISSKNTSIKLKNKETFLFKDLSIKSLKCKNSEFDDDPEITAYIQVKDLTDKKNDEVFVFNGWMFSSSPSIAPFDHPVYDIWLTNCY